MQNLIEQMQIKVNEKTYLKDPTSSDLGKNILSKSVLLIDEIGLEAFTFRKLAKEMETTESSIYRYFESKHKLLIYLTSWYWCWIEYQLLFATTNITSPIERLNQAIGVVAKDISGKEWNTFIDLEVLNRIVISESSKTFFIKNVDEANKIGFYSGYKRLVKQIAEIVLEINPDFNYAHTLISTIVEGIHYQKYFAEHLPSLTDIKSDSQELATFYSEMALAIIQKKNK